MPPRNDLIDRVTAAMARAGLSSLALAARANLDRKTVDEFLKQKSTPRNNTVKRICDALSINETDSSSDGLAPEELGGYHASAVSHILGEYVMFRRSFDYPDRVIASRFLIFHDEPRSIFRFKEYQLNKSPDGEEFKYVNVGDISVPQDLGIYHFVSGQGGAKRMLSVKILGRDPSISFRGVLCAINVDLSHGNFFPCVSPVYLSKIPDESLIEDDMYGSFLIDEFWNQESIKELKKASAVCMPQWL